MKFYIANKKKEVDLCAVPYKELYDISWGKKLNNNIEIVILGMQTIRYV